MPSHVAFLRAINLGRNRRLPMPLVQDTLTRAGFAGVQTYLATGNVLVESAKRSRAVVEREIEAALGEASGFEVPTIVLSPQELADVHAAATALQVPAQRRYLSFLKHEPTAEAAAELDGWDAPGEGAKVLGRAVLWWIDHPNAVARLSNARLEKMLGVATTRDLKVVATLARRWCS